MNQTTKRITLEDAEFLLQSQGAVVQARTQIALLEQVASAHERGAAEVLRVLAGKADWKLSRDEGGYLLTQASPDEKTPNP
jgi:hypothetical protein